MEFDRPGRGVGGVVEHVQHGLFEPVGRQEDPAVARQGRLDARIRPQHLPAIEQGIEPGVERLRFGRRILRARGEPGQNGFAGLGLLFDQPAVGADIRVVGKFGGQLVRGRL